ncbi:MAG: type III-A CRISPR-associated protein Cas10/Csm1 [Thermodesulfobacteriota bacterium]|nr:type III-A CRISPR-associated protein Cas10/Csm1 [Thermodesulfobacteriota bacterium]
MPDELKIVVLSALIHDIGKFAQRAKRPYTKSMEGVYLRNYKGKPGHWHTVYSDYFLENDLPLLEEFEKSRSLIARTASAHHKPDTENLMEMCVAIADRLSSGSDRIEMRDNESKTGFRESRLVPVFDEVELVKHTFDSPGNFYYNLAPLDTSSSQVFPKRGKPEGEAEEYIPLYKLFSEELACLKVDSGFRFYFESLVSLMEKYTWAIPSSSYKTLSDISLFDHSFSTAGIAQALYMYHTSSTKMPTWQDNEKKFILLGGDLSGIQKYIFGISNSSGRGVSKIFRARSFFLQAISRSIILKIQKRIGLFSVCRLVDSGGKFILLLPNIPGVVNELDKLDKEIQGWFLTKFKGLLTMTLCWSTLLTQQDFQLANFQKKFDEINEVIDSAKLRKMKNVLAQHGPVIHSGYNDFEGGNCSLCEINAADDVSSAKYEQIEGATVSICRDCCDHILYIGTRLPKSNYLIYSGHGKIPLFGDIFLSLSKELPKDIKEIFHIETMADDASFSKARIAKHLPEITKDELADENWLQLFDKEDGFRELINSFNEDSGGFAPKTFSMIALKSKKQLKNGSLTGRPLLAFLKADVDNLGLIFSLGLGDKLSVARLASLSRLMNIFFSEFLVQLLKKEFPDIYVVFSGGDDLFLIGPWRQTVLFAITLRKKLTEFCANNSDITLSCGTLITKPRLPVRTAVEITEEQLDLAKKYNGEGRKKDSIVFLGETLSWAELESLMETGKLFDKALEDKARTNFTTAFLYRLLTYNKMYRKFVFEGQLKSGIYLSQAYYDIARNIRNDKYNNQKELEMLYRIFSVGSKNRSELDMLHIPLFYALNLNRDSK